MILVQNGRRFITHSPTISNSDRTFLFSIVCNFYFKLHHSILEIIASYFIIVVGSSNEITNVSSSVEFLVSFNLEGLSLLSVCFLGHAAVLCSLLVFLSFFERGGSKWPKPAKNSSPDAISRIFLLKF